MKDKMLALVKAEAKPGLNLMEIPVPDMGPNDVKIKIQKTSICGTDVHIYNWDEWAQQNIRPPMAIGHEYMGVVADVGSMVRTVKIGDLVSGEGHLVCNVCRNCLAGKRHLCRNTKGVGVNRPGAFAEYLVIPSENVVKLEPGIDPEICAIFDPLGNAVHTALKFNLVGEDVVITGAGPIGIMAAAVARHCGARNVVLTDLNRARLALAREVEANIVTVHVPETRLDEVMADLRMKEGFDVALEMSGSVQALQDVIDHMEHGGKIALLGIQKENGLLNINKIISKGLVLQGIYGREMFETWYKMMAMLKSGLDIRTIITQRIDFRDFELGFAAMNSGGSGKVIMDWTTVEEGL